MVNEELPDELFNRDRAFPYVYPLAHVIGWTDDEIITSLKMYEDVGITGSCAGTSLRTLLLTFVKSDPGFQLLLTDYDIQYKEVDPSNHTLEEILKTFIEHNVTSRHLVCVFGYPAGVDLVDLKYKYEDEHTWT
jgi:hypothetical protein